MEKLIYPQKKGSDSSNSGEKDQIDDSKTESQKMFWEDGIESRIQCSYCSSDFEKKIQLDAHVKDKHELKSFDCGFCGSSFSEKSDLHAHVKEEHISKKFQCKYCGTGYAEQNELSIHVKGSLFSKGFFKYQLHSMSL